MSDLNLINQHGEPVTIDSAELPEALKAGYRQPTQNEITEQLTQQKYGEGLGNELKAFGEGALRSASFGTSDLLLPKLPFGPTVEALKERQNRNPISSIAGTAAGILGSVLLPESGLVGAAGKGATAAGEAVAPMIGGAIANKTAANILSKVGASAVGNGVLGALYGTGNVLSEAALGDPALTAQKALAQVGISGLLGGAIGAGLKASELGFPKAMELTKSAKAVADTATKDAPLFDPFTKAPYAEGALAHIPEESSNSSFAKGMANFAIKSARAAILPRWVDKAIDWAIDWAPQLLKAETLANIEGLVNKTNSAIESSVSNIFNAAKPMAPLLVAASSKALTMDYDKASSQIQDLNDLDGALDKIHNATKEIAPHAPEITDHLHMTMASAASFLNSKLPKTSVDAPLSEPFDPSNAEKEKFLHYYNVVNKPLLALSEMKQGTLTNDTVEAIASVHPNLYEAMKEALLNGVMVAKSKKAQIPYQTKAMLSQFLQEPLDESFMPSSIAATQSVYAVPANLSGNNMGGGRTKKQAMRLTKLNVAGRAMLPTQKVNLGQKL